MDSQPCPRGLERYSQVKGMVSVEDKKPHLGPTPRAVPPPRRLQTFTGESQNHMTM